MIGDDRIDWFCWVLVNGRNNWWPPDETGRECAESMPGWVTEDDVEREQAVHRAKFNALDELVYVSIPARPQGVLQDEPQRGGPGAV